jgi:SAM-dependent methyltransferase
VPVDVRPGRNAPSRFFESHLDAILATRKLGPVLDLACGSGRHALALAEHPLRIVALDRNHESLSVLEKAARQLPGSIEICEADLETGTPPRLEAAPFGAVLVFRYLYRPLMPWITQLLAPGGLLLYETFTVAQRNLGWGPQRDAFLLEPGELPGLFPDLEILVYEEGRTLDQPPAETARLLARRPTARSRG